jgi:DNA topoisomerase-3
MDLLIAEKPSMALDIARALGADVVRRDGYFEVAGKVVSYAIGHLIGLEEPQAYDAKYGRWRLADLPIVIPDGQWKMRANPKTAAQLAIVGKLIKKAKRVTHCGDAAREGQMIVDELLDYFDYRGPVRRLWLQEMNLPAIQRALAAAKDNAEYRNLYCSAMCRSEADWSIGMNLTRAYTEALRAKGGAGVLHFGRVQTNVLSMIVERDELIENFEPKDIFSVTAEVAVQGGTFAAQWLPPEDARFVDEAGRVVERAAAQAVVVAVAGQTGVVASCETVRDKKKLQPLPYSLGDLQKEVNRAFGLSPSDTLKIVQSLYETHKLTSYPRTDFSHLPEDEHGLGRSIIEACMSNFGADWDFPGAPDYTIRSHAWNSKKIGDHHGIRPTARKGYNLGALSKMELAVYKLIVRRFLAQFYPVYLYDATSVRVACAGHLFKAAGAVEKQKGWQVLYPGRGNGKEDGQDVVLLPAMQKGEPARIAAAKVNEGKTKPPPRFNGALIIDAMEKAYKLVTDERVKKVIREIGIGTPATRANIVDDLISRWYIEERPEGKGSVYISTPRGRALYKCAPVQLRKPDLTAYFEELLARVSEGKMSAQDFMTRQVQFVSKLVDAVKSGEATRDMPSDIPVAPQRRAAPAGKPAAKGRRKPAAGAAKAAKTQAGTATAHVGEGAKACPKCGKAMRARSSASGQFFGCSAFPACRHTENG